MVHYNGKIPELVKTTRKWTLGSHVCVYFPTEVVSFELLREFRWHTRLTRLDDSLLTRYDDPVRHERRPKWVFNRLAKDKDYNGKEKYSIYERAMYPEQTFDAMKCRFHTFSLGRLNASCNTSTCKFVGCCSTDLPSRFIFVAKVSLGVLETMAGEERGSLFL